MAKRSLESSDRAQSQKKPDRKCGGCGYWHTLDEDFGGMFLCMYCASEYNTCSYCNFTGMMSQCENIHCDRKNYACNDCSEKWSGEETCNNCNPDNVVECGGCKKVGYRSEIEYSGDWIVCVVSGCKRCYCGECATEERVFNAPLDDSKMDDDECEAVYSEREKRDFDEVVCVGCVKVVDAHHDAIIGELDSHISDCEGCFEIFSGCLNDVRGDTSTRGEILSSIGVRKKSECKVLIGLAERVSKYITIYDFQLK